MPGGGNAPPRPECGPAWYGRLLAVMPERGLPLRVGSYAQAFYRGPRRKATMTETVQAFADYLPRFLPLPHPSWRNTAWLARNPWFERRLLPVLRKRVAAALKED